jgi:hypothetical protein
VTNTGGGFNKVNVAPIFYTSTGVGLLSIESYSSTSLTVASHDYVAQTGVQALPYTCSGTCSTASYTVTSKWDMYGTVSLTTACPSFPAGTTITARVFGQVRAEVYDTTTSTLTGSTSATAFYHILTTCPATSSGTTTFNGNLDLIVGLTYGDSYVIKSYTSWETVAYISLGGVPTQALTSDAVANFGSPATNNVKLVQIVIA